MKPTKSNTDWKTLTLRQKIGQTMIMLPNRKLELELGGDSLETYFERYPIVDLNLNPMDPLICTRAIAGDADRAVRLLTRQIIGIQENGGAATAKTFPGDGADHRDQHLCTTCNPLSMVDWWRTYGKVFQSAIDAGVMSIMPGHFTLPAYQKVKNESIDGFHPPATLSKALQTDLLKREMGFKGVIVSDSMMMGGFRGYYPTQMEGEIQSFLAGTDAMLWPAYFERVHTCINAYSYDESTQSAVVRALMGEILFVGDSPVSLERSEFQLKQENWQP